MSQFASDMDAAEAELQQELREMFAVETQQQLETYFNTIDRLNASSWQQDIQQLYRTIHTLKGGAVTVSADAMLHAAIALEDLLADLRYLEQAPPLDDGRLVEILQEAGELLSSSIEVTATGDRENELIQPTVDRLQQLCTLVKQLYLPDWNELKQVHQEFAEQGFELVTLELEMALAQLPDRGLVTDRAIDIAKTTLDRLAQIGVDLELDEGWSLSLQCCAKLIDRPDCRGWKSIWPQYFQFLQVCVKNSGKLTDTDFDCLDLIERQEIDDPSDLTEQIGNSQTDNEIDFGSQSSLDRLDFEDDIVAERSMDADREIFDSLDMLFVDEKIDLAPLRSTSEILPPASVPANIDDISDEIVDLLDDFFLDAEIDGETDFEDEEDISEDLDISADLNEPNIEDYILVEREPALASDINEEIIDLIDDLFMDEDLSIEVNETSIEEYIVVDRSTVLPEEASDNFIDSYNNLAVESTDRGDKDRLADALDRSAVGSAQSIAIELNRPEVPAPETVPVDANEQSIEPIKRNIQITVPLERLDRAAQQVIDTLLTARAVIGVADRLQSQVNQLTNLTQESAQYITRLRQLQDNYALLRDDRQANDRVNLERYRQGYTIINRLLENILRMSELGQEIETANRDSSTRLDALDRSILQLKDGIETSRLIPFRNLTLKARAILRDLTNRYGKPAELITRNERIELDASIVQQLEPALLHLLRNAYDHGLESTSMRQEVGKSAQGQITVSIDRFGNLYRLKIADDGQGIDANKIEQIARSKGFPLHQGRTSAELLAILCQPGFSSSSAVSEVSGRGVGMDVVVAQIASIGGKLSLETQLGQGTTFSIEIPAPQLLIPCVLLQVGERTIGIPSDEILETALLSSLHPESIAENDASICSWILTTSRGPVAGFDLANYWQADNRSFPDTAIAIRTRQVEGTTEIWSIADNLLVQAELSISPLPKPLIAPVGLLGVSLQPDGKMISILDPIALTTRISTTPNDSIVGAASQNENGHFTSADSEPSKPSAPTILIVDDAALMRRRFESSLNNRGFITHTCNDGLEALKWLQSNQIPDLMITDVEMPNMDGFTLIDRCRQSGIDIPILVVSSRLSEEWGKEAHRLGASDYLTKGFSTAELFHKVDLLLGAVV